MPSRRPRRARSLALHRAESAPVAPPPSGRGKLYYDFQIPDEFYAGLPGVKNKVRWVREHLPRASRIKIGAASAWYESDILAYIQSQREDERLAAKEKASA